MLSVELNSRTRKGLVRARASVAQMATLTEGARVRVIDAVAGFHGSARVVARRPESNLVHLDVDWDSLEAVDFGSIEGDPPPAEVCPACGESTPYVQDDNDNEWDLDGEWWHDRALGIRYADSSHCLSQLRGGR